jgi:hypothetical protein
MLRKGKWPNKETCTIRKARGDGAYPMELADAMERWERWIQQLAAAVAGRLLQVPCNTLSGTEPDGPDARETLVTRRQVPKDILHVQLSGANPCKARNAGEKRDKEARVP